MSKQETPEINLQLKLAQIQSHLDQVKQSFKDLTNLADDSKELREWAMQQLTQYALSVKSSKLDKDELENFFKYPYCIMPGKHKNEYYLIIPKFIDAHFGWLYKTTESHNIFLVNKYVDWLGELPDHLKRELKFQDPLDIVLDGEYLTGKDIKKAKQKYAHFIKGQTKEGKLIIDKTRHFELLANLIKDGILPFIPKPIDREDMIKSKCEIELRDYQRKAYEEFLQYGNIGAFFPASTGKTYLSIYALANLKPKHLVVVPTRLLVEQWVERIELYTDLKVGWWRDERERKHVFEEYEKENIDVIVCTYYGATKYCSHIQWQLIVIDEVHHLPSDEFSKLAVIPRKYLIGLSASPQREDEREEYIFALTGKPVGLAWEVFKKLGIIQNPPMHVWIVKSDQDRMKQLERLFKTERKTLIFCDSIALGSAVAKRFDIPHVHGETKQRLAEIKNANNVVVSRVADEGVSLPDIERVIEINWLHGSRRQELQRFTRLLHGRNTEGEAHIIMTVQEYQSDHKRLFSLMDKGFKIVLHREGMEEKVISGYGEEREIRKEYEPRIKLNKKTQERKIIYREPKEEKPKIEIIDHPILSLPGIQKKLNTLRQAERNAINLLFQREKEEFTRHGLCILLGYSSTDSMQHQINFPKLKEMKLITEEKGKIKADLSLIGLAKP